MNTASLPSAAPHVQDIDFFAAHAVIIGTHHYDIAWREEAVLALLSADADEQEERADSTALSLTTFDGNGFVVDRSMSLKELLSLTWSEDVNDFVDPQGQVYRFHFSVDAREWFNQRSLDNRCTF